MFVGSEELGDQNRQSREWGGEKGQVNNLTAYLGISAHLSHADSHKKKHKQYISMLTSQS